LIKIDYATFKSLDFWLIAIVSETRYIQFNIATILDLRIPTKQKLLVFKNSFNLELHLFMVVQIKNQFILLMLW
jgi:hypothetical protein